MICHAVDGEIVNHSSTCDVLYGCIVLHLRLRPGVVNFNIFIFFSPAAEGH